MESSLLFTCLMAALLGTTLAASVSERGKRDLSCYGMTATCDNELKVYFDGVLQPGEASELNDWTRVSQFCVPYGTQVIGIECLDLHVVAGTLASFSDGSVTDGSWQCSSQASDGWALPSFPASSWPDAYEIGTNGMTPWGTRSGISNSAQWIWTTGWHGEDTNVFCRKVVNTVEECSQCAYEGDFGYLAHSDPCNFTMCQRVSGPDGYIYYHTMMRCASGTLWDQSLLTCVHDTERKCVRTPVPTYPVPGDCRLEEVDGDETKFRDQTTGLVLSCATGTVFREPLCTCVHGINPETCEEPLLYFPFDDHFNSEGCEKIVSVGAGSGSVSLSWDAKKMKSAQFDGNSLLLVPFLNNYFANNDVRVFTVALWFKWTGDASSIGGLVNNGNCGTDVSSFDIHLGPGQTVFASASTDDAAHVSAGTFSVNRWDWVHIAEVYDGSTLKLYINGDEKSSASLTGPIANTHCSLSIGQTGEEGTGFFKGHIDELMLFMKALDLGEIEDLVALNYDYLD